MAFVTYLAHITGKSPVKNFTSKIYYWIEVGPKMIAAG